MRKTFLFILLLSFTGAFGQTPMYKLLRKKASTFIPSDSAGLVRWYQANLGTGSYANNDPMGTWDDQSSSALDATSASTGRPLFKTNIQNGQPAVLFDGVNDYFTMSGINASPGNTVFIVYKKTASAKFPTLVSQTGPNNPYSWFEWTDNKAYLKTKNCASGDYSATAGYSSAFVTVAVTTTACGTMSARVNGSAITLTGIAGTGSNSNWDAIGFRSADIADGYFFAIAVFDHVATSQLLTDMENYFKSILNHY